MNRSIALIAGAGALCWVASSPPAFSPKIPPWPLGATSQGPPAYASPGYANGPLGILALPFQDRRGACSKCSSRQTAHSARLPALSFRRTPTVGCGTTGTAGTPRCAACNFKKGRRLSGRRPSSSPAGRGARGFALSVRAAFLSRLSDLEYGQGDAVGMPRAAGDEERPCQPLMGPRCGFKARRAAEIHLGGIDRLPPALCAPSPPAGRSERQNFRCTACSRRLAGRRSELRAG